MYDETPDAHPTIEALRKRRRYLGVTQRELGALLGVSEHHVRRLELGDVKAKDADIAAALFRTNHAAPTTLPRTSDPT